MCYKECKKVYRKTCKLSIDSRDNRMIYNMNNLYRDRSLKKFWNAVKKTKRGQDNDDDIDISVLHGHFKTKFSHSECNSEVLNNATCLVTSEVSRLSEQVHYDKAMSPSMVVSYIRRLRSGSAPGEDGITSEHLKYALESSIVDQLSTMFTICFRYGIVPINFTRGLLVPLLKKPTLDPTKPTSYRPISISSIISKLIELHILDVSGGHTFSDLQFGFVPGRGTGMAVSVVNDVISYCNKRGSAVYTCALDAEGAFDAVPHDILFMKALNVIPDYCWLLMVRWYRDIVVHIKWGGHLSGPINVCKGTRQGGLSSPFLFNLFYQGMIDTLSQRNDGICINGSSFNVFCYADDLLLTSLTATGLQRMIDYCSTYITSHGLRFNPQKTECVVFGECSLEPHPTWALDGVLLNEVDNVKYLGVTLSRNNPDAHVNDRINACRRSFYSLQGAGFNNWNSDVDCTTYLWNAAVRPVLTYGLNCINMSKSTMSKVEKLQTKLLKAANCLHKFTKSTPLLNALNVRKIETTNEMNMLSLLKSSLCNSSRARKFYMHLIDMDMCGNLHGHCSLVNRVKSTCLKHDISFLKYVLDDNYSSHCKSVMKTVKSDGLSDSVRQLLMYKDPYNKYLLNLLLIPF